MPNPGSARPIDFLSGAKTFSEDDFESADGALRLTRKYNTQGLGGVGTALARLPIGLGNWYLDFQYELQIPDQSFNADQVTIIAPEGGIHRFKKQSDGSVAPYYPSSRPEIQYMYKLEMLDTWPSNLRTSQTHWRLTDPNDNVWLFETKLDSGSTTSYVIGRPTSVTSRDGLVRTFTYDSANHVTKMEDSYGKSITFDWADNVITKAHLPGGYSVEYTYQDTETLSAQKRLREVKLVNGSSVVVDSAKYDYDEPYYETFITGVRDKNDVLRWSVDYDDQGRATSSSGPSGVDSVTVSYANTGTSFSRTVTNALGKQATYNFTRQHAAWLYGVQFVGVTGVASTNCPSSSTSNTYVNGMVRTSTDEEGRATRFTWDARGQATQINEAYGTALQRDTNTTYHSTLHVPTLVTEPKQTTSFSYSSGRLTSKTITDTTSYTVPYTTNGRTRTWAYTYSGTGQLLTVDGPLAGIGDTVTYTYNADGYLQTSTNQVGQTTTVSAWNWRGQPLTIVDPNSVTSTLTYDVQGRPLTTTINPGGSQSQYAFEYDAVGNLTKMTLPAGGFLEYAYDTAGRLTEIENDRGETQTFAVNAMGDPTSLTVRTSGSTITKQQSFAYDELGRLIQSIGAGSQTTGFTYDKVDNRKSRTDARGKLFQTSFDALDRVISETNPQNQVVQYAYEPADRLTSHKDGRNLETTQVVDGFGQVIREVSPDRGTLSYWYDAAGNVTKIVDGDGQETNFTYDAASRLLTSSYTGASGETITYAYDSTSGGNKGVGRLTSVTEESGSTAFVYDAQGRIVTDTKTIQGRSYAVGYAYDVNGEVTQITLPSGRTVSFTRASDGLATAISTKATPSSSVNNLATSIAYRPFGPVGSLTYGNGLTLTRTYDNNYWLAQTEVKATGATRLDLSFGRNADGQLTSVTDNAASGRGATFTYTDAGRLASANGPWGDDVYTYDAAGNRTSKVRTIGGTPSTETAVMASTSNRVNQVQDGSSTTLRTLTYRAGGDRSQDAHAGSAPDYDYAYNARKRLVAVDKNGADAAWYGYDFQGRRVWRTVFGTTTVQSHYVFDQQGHLLAEHDGATGNLVREYVWLDDMPVAMIDASTGTSQTYFIHTGQIEEPLVMTDASKAKVWDAYVEPYGQAQAFGTPSAGLDLRLPGQWLQAQSGGLHQNWHRDYDPSLGRYIETDPLGVEAGQNVYAYVDGRILEFADTQGLMDVHLRGGNVRISMYPGPPAGGIEHARFGPGNSYHMHLIGKNSDIRISTETWGPLTPDDARKLAGDKVCRNFLGSITDAEKRYLRAANRDIFHTGRISGPTNMLGLRARLESTTARRSSPSGKNVPQIIRNLPPARGGSTD